LLAWLHPVFGDVQFDNFIRKRFLLYGDAASGDRPQFFIGRSKLLYSQFSQSWNTNPFILGTFYILLLHCGLHYGSARYAFHNFDFVCGIRPLSLLGAGDRSPSSQANLNGDVFLRSSEQS